VRSLRRLIAIGPETSTVLANEVFYRRFRSRRHLASYVGLTPSSHMSGGLSREQGISSALEQHLLRRRFATSQGAHLQSGSPSVSASSEDGSGESLL
jgi:transposase